MRRNLSDIELNVDGFIQDDVVENRRAANNLIKKYKHIDPICAMSEELMNISRSLGSYAGSEYDEEFWDEDLF